ncbi:MAG TPA: tetratricopeptide repeat protein [Planctomycetota bacterium]|nr:tetratricopeptide repeat protein [Planctomycetota bacterium]
MGTPGSAPPAEDLLFAQLVLAQGLCTRERVDECLSLLARLTREGVAPLPRLGELLVRRGYLTADQAEATLRPPSSSSGSRGATRSRPGELPAEVAAAWADPANAIGKYVRVSRIGAGGMGEVYRAWDRDLGRWVALKFLKHDEPEELARFQREARTAARLSHPHIASVYEVGEAGGKPFIAMQFVDGQTFARFPRNRVREVVELVRDAALAIHHAHEQGVVHRDLKPANLMVESSTSVGRPRVFVMDFGLARQTQVDSSLSVAGQILGTPAYMSPEQARGDLAAVGERSDLYSLGATLYEMLTDRPPFQEKDVYGLLKKVVEAEPVPIRKLTPKVDRDLETIVMKCLEKDPGRRYGTALEFAQDLGRWLGGEAILAHPPSTAYRAWKFASRRKGILSVAAGGVAAVTLVAGILIPKVLAQSRAREADRQSAFLREQALKELGSLWAEAVVVKEWTRQAFRQPAQIRDELQKVIGKVGDYIRRHPDHPQGYYVRARERRDFGDFAGAEEDLGEATRLAPAFAPGWALLARVKLDRYYHALFGADELTRMEQTAAAESLLGQAQQALARGWSGGAEGLAVERWGLSRTREDEINDTVVRALEELWTAKNEPGAIALVREAQERSPSEEYCRLLGNWSHDAAGKAAWYDRELQIAPHFAAGYFDRGNARAATGNPAGAIEDFTRAVTIDPLHALAFGNRGVARQERGDFRGAVEDFTRQMELEPGVATARCHRAMAYHDLGELDRALEDFNGALAVDSRLTRGYYGRGLLWMDRGELEKARADLTRAVEISPKFAEAYTNLGLLSAEKGDMEGAIREFTRAIEARPGYARAYYNRGLARWTRKDGAGAIEDYTRALEAEPRYVDALANRGLVRQASGALDAAIADFERALDVAPPGWGHRKAVESWRDAARSEKGR